MTPRPVTLVPISILTFRASSAPRTPPTCSCPSSSPPYHRGRVRLLLVASIQKLNLWNPIVIAGSAG
jgi:hypothetical protein